MLRLSLQRLVDLLLSGASVQVFGQILSELSAKTIANTILQDEGEYTSDCYPSSKEVLTDAYLMSGQNLED